MDCNINNAISVVIPTWNEEGNIELLVKRIHDALSKANITYEIIIIDDHSTDNTQKIVLELCTTYPIKPYLKNGKRGKAQSLLQGFSVARYDLIAMIDADLQYPPEAIPSMIDKISSGADVIVAKRIESNINILRKVASRSFNYIFAKKLHGLEVDTQSGLKVFYKEVVGRFKLSPSPWTFDLEFLTKAKNAGYKIDSIDIAFSKRHSGASKLGVLTASYEIGSNAVKLKMKRAEIFPFNQRLEKEKGKGFHYKGKEFVHHSQLHHTQTAFHRFSGVQLLYLLDLLLIFEFALILNWHLTIVFFVALLTFLYFSDLLFNLYLVYRTFSKPAEIQVSDEEIRVVPEESWPRYTILCPLYKEWQVLLQFVSAMSRLEYPKDKLQVMLLLEEDDKETIKHARAFDLPNYFEIVTVPYSLPKTKPKACNYGLKFANGEYSVIYDAEDVPDTLQLKKSVLAFQKAGNSTICVQAKLNFYNPHQNLLTRIFTAEYSLWFDLVLTGLQSINAPIPLGGTSNHFRTTDLFKLKGWDSFNVTEDADLGMRLVKLGYQTAVVDSVTLEEANADLKNWFWQRTRWIKGYMQTYLVHMRNPLDFIQNWKEPHVVTFQLVIGGKVMSMFINPFMWATTIAYFLFRAHIGAFIESFFPAPVLYMGVFSLLFGNFLYMYYYMIGCAKHGHYELVKYAILTPLYWLAMSVAAWVAFYKLIIDPHYWAKTKHGLHLNNKKALEHATKTIGSELVDEQLTPYSIGGIPTLALEKINKL